MLFIFLDILPFRLPDKHSNRGVYFKGSFSIKDSNSCTFSFSLFEAIFLESFLLVVKIIIDTLYQSSLSDVM